MEGKNLINSGKLAITQSPEGTVDLNIGAEFRWFQKRKGLMHWNTDGLLRTTKARRHLIIGPGGNVFEFGAHPSAQIGPKTRASLNKLGIKSAKVLCRVKAYYNNDLQHNVSNSDEKLLTLPITFS